MKNLQFPEQDYLQLVTLARQAGYRVSRGRASQLRLFVMTAAKALKPQKATAKASIPDKASHDKS